MLIEYQCSPNFTCDQCTYFESTANGQGAGMAAMAFQWSLAALETLMAEDQMDQHAAVLRAFSVVELWRLRRVCRAFHRWGTAALAALPRIVVVGEFAPALAREAVAELLAEPHARAEAGAHPADQRAGA